jgi:putative effector of murein hydrolase LrgA (UPF0299 family)
MRNLYGLFTFAAITLLCKALDLSYPLPIPADLIGLIGLFAYLSYKRHIPSALEDTSNFLFSNIGLLYIPAGVSLINYLDFMVDYWKVVIIAALLTTAITLIICAAIFNAIEEMQQVQQTRKAQHT